MNKSPVLAIGAQRSGGVNLSNFAAGAAELDHRRHQA
jgi:hypothetical protein